MTRPVNGMSIPGRSSFLEEAIRGALRLDLIAPFPAQPAEDRTIGDGLVAEAKEFARGLVDPEELDRTGAMPPEAIERLRKSVYIKLQSPREVGGLELSDLNTFRVIQAICSWSLPLGLVVAVQNSIGFGPLIRILPEGPLREMLVEKVGRGLISGFADTEPAGAANHRRDTVAVPTEDGAAYLVSGEKVFSGNTPFAELLGVIATVREDGGSGAGGAGGAGGRETRRLLVVDPEAPGVTRKVAHEFMGVRGVPNGGFTLESVRVPREHVFVEKPSAHDVRITAQAGGLAILGRMYLISAPALALAKLCLDWSRGFVRRRSVDGVPLGEYEEIQHQLGESLADTFALEAVAEWSLLCEDAGLNPLFEQAVAKNVTSLLCWRVVERTMSLFAAEGYETAASKQRRGAPPVPVERAFRDARNLRISGGVDFQLDYWLSKLVVFSYHRADALDDGSGAEAAAGARERLRAALSPRNQEHLDRLHESLGAFRDCCADLARRHPEDADLMARERALIAVARWVTEIMTATLTLARAARSSGGPDAGGSHAGGAGAGGSDAQDLADIYCTGALERAARHAREAVRAHAPGTRRVTERWIRSEGHEGLLDDIITGPAQEAREPRTP